MFFIPQSVECLFSEHSKPKVNFCLARLRNSKCSYNWINIPKSTDKLTRILWIRVQRKRDKKCRRYVIAHVQILKFNMASRLSGHFSIFGLVFFVLKSLLGIARQWSRENFAISTLKPRSHVRILIYRTWAIGSWQECKKKCYSTNGKSLLLELLYARSARAW